MLKSQLIDKISRSSKKCHQEVFLFIKQHNIVYTQNKNGIFIDVSLFTNEIIMELENIIKICSESDDLKTNLITNSNNIFDNSEKIDNASKQIEIHKIKGTEKHIIVNHEQVAVFEKDKQKVFKKNVHLKFNTAIKKYNKFSTNDIKKNEFNNTTDILTQESYIVI